MPGWRAICVLRGVGAVPGCGSPLAAALAVCPHRLNRRIAAGAVQHLLAGGAIPVPQPLPTRANRPEMQCFTTPMRCNARCMAGASRLAGLGAGGSTIRPTRSAIRRWGRWSPPGSEVFAHASAQRGKPEFGLETRDRRQEDRRGRRGYRAAQAVRAAQAFSPRRASKRPAAAADRRADVGPLCDAAARHGRADAAQAGRVHHRLARRQAGADRGGAASISTIISII